MHDVFSAMWVIVVITIAIIILNTESNRQRAFNKL